MKQPCSILARRFSSAQWIVRSLLVVPGRLVSRRMQGLVGGPGGAPLSPLKAATPSSPLKANLWTQRSVPARPPSACAAATATAIAPLLAPLSGTPEAPLRLARRQLYQDAADTSTSSRASHVPDPSSLWAPEGPAGIPSKPAKCDMTTTLVAPDATSSPRAPFAYPWRRGAAQPSVGASAAAEHMPSNSLFERQPALVGAPPVAAARCTPPATPVAAAAALQASAHPPRGPSAEGSIELITGPMFAGKSTELLQRANEERARG